jgi:signal transduction histidine kinase
MAERWRTTVVSPDVTTKLFRAEAAAAVVLVGAAPAAWSVTGGTFWPRWVWFGVAVVIAAQVALGRALRTPPGRRRWFAVHAAVVGVLLPADVLLWVLTGGGFFWPIGTTLLFAVTLSTHAWALERPPGRREQELTARVERLTRTRSGTLDAQAQELRRIERDLHDGAQARLVSLGMMLGLAENLLHTDPHAAGVLLAEARAGTKSALRDLREVMQSVHPSVLADRGLPGAVQALALDLAVSVEVRCDLPGIAPPAIESAMYFAVAEALANVVKHAHAQQVTVDLGHAGGRLVAVVEDDGVGGATLDKGTGLEGTARRLEAFDGIMRITSPTGGPTSIRLEVPCALSSPKT